MTDQRTFVRVDGHLLRVSVRGEGTPILLIMGLGGNIEMWAPLERELNAHGYQTIAYDASGTGNSPARLVPLRPSGLARQAAHLLDALGLPTVDVLGVSFGGGVAQELTLRNPHRVRRLVLASTMCGLGGVPGTPLALAVLATPLRYYSPRFLRATADSYSRTSACLLVSASATGSARQRSVSERLAQPNAGRRGFDAQVRCRDRLLEGGPKRPCLRDLRPGRASSSAAYWRGAWARHHST